MSKLDRVSVRSLVEITLKLSHAANWSVYDAIANNYTSIAHQTHMRLQLSLLYSSAPELNQLVELF